jgi:hypothetical protein
MDWFELEIPINYSSNLDPCGQKNELLVDLLIKIGATDYVSGVGARSYFSPKPYESAGIAVHWQEFNHPRYPQQFGEFMPYLSCIDAFFNCGVERTRKMLRDYK